MEAIVKAAWIALAALHAAPAAILFDPSLAQRLYRVAPEGALGVLLTHRGALFLAVAAAALWAAFDPASRRLGALVIAISMVGFLIVYVRAGQPPGALRTVAIMDLIGIAPLALAAWSAFLTRG